MKKIKVFFGCLMVFSLIVGVFILNDRKEYSYYLAIGDYVSNNQVIDNSFIEGFSHIVGNCLKEDKIVNEVNTSYIKNNITSKKLLEMIEKGSYYKEDKGIVELIEKSKYITISLGINDLINQIKYDSYKNELLYDKEVVENKLEIFKHNYHKVLEEIKDINDNAKVILVGCYSIYNDEEFTARINSFINDIANEMSVYYLDVGFINDTMHTSNELYLNNLGQQEISSNLISLIKKLEVN